MKNYGFRIACLFLLMVMQLSLSAQSEDSVKTEKSKNTEEPKKGFKKDKLFTGGGITLSISNNGTVMGATPVLGYSIAKWIDAGILFNFIYASQRHLTYTDQNNNLYYTDDKVRKTLYGPGAFLRIYPVNFLFVQAQGEINFIREKIIYAPNTPLYISNGAASKVDKFSPLSFLVGGGYCQGREDSGDMFYYVSILFDIAKDFNSPYVEQQYSDMSVNVLPIIRAGIQIPLFQK